MCGTTELKRTTILVSRDGMVKFQEAPPPLVGIVESGSTRMGGTLRHGHMECVNLSLRPGRGQEMAALTFRNLSLEVWEVETTSEVVDGDANNRLQPLRVQSQVSWRGAGSERVQVSLLPTSRLI